MFVSEALKFTYHECRNMMATERWLSSPLWHGTSQTLCRCRQSIVFYNCSSVLIDILHHQYSARPSSTAVFETAELMNRYLAVADAFKDRFQIKVFLVNSHLSDGTCLVSRLAPFHHHLRGC